MSLRLLRRCQTTSARNLVSVHLLDRRRIATALVAAVNVGWQATLSILNASHAEAAVVVDAQDAELALLRSELDRLALENDALRGEVEAARQRRWWWPWR